MNFTQTKYKKFIIPGTCLLDLERIKNTNGYVMTGVKIIQTQTKSKKFIIPTICLLDLERIKNTNGDAMMEKVHKGIDFNDGEPKLAKSRKNIRYYTRLQAKLHDNL